MIILEIGDFIAIIGNMIYLEVFEIRVCGLDYDLTKNIGIRGIKDYNNSFSPITDTLSEEDDDKTEEKEKSPEIN